MVRFFVPMLFLLTAAAVAAEPGSAPAPSAEAEAAQYAHCMQLAREAPQSALASAESWRKKGGAHPAEHCAAVALIGLKRYREAASRLAALALAMGKAPAALRAGVLDQEGQAWLLAGDAASAYAAAGAAVALAPDDPDLIVDRAEAAGLFGRFEDAVRDLDRVLQANPNRVDALVYRASAYRALQRLAPALADAEKAVALSPDLAPALLERGNIRRLAGDAAGARADWQRVLEIAPGSAEAATAKANIAALDAGKPGPVKPGGTGTRGAAGPRS